MIERDIDIVWPHPPAPSGGPGTFQQHVIDSGPAFGIRTISESDHLPDAVLVTAGTRRIFWLWKMRRRGVRIVQRLDGIAWRDYLQPIGFRRKTMAYLGSRLVAFIRRHLADHIVYQSEFVRGHWNRRFGEVSTPWSVVLNGTDLEVFRPKETDSEPKPVLLSVDGHIQPGTWAVEIVEEIARSLVPDVVSKIVLVGEPSVSDRTSLESVSGVDVRGLVARSAMPGIYRDADLFLSLEVQPPCPNSIIEALASGLPVAAFDTGAAREILGDGAGMLVPYGSDPWRLEKPDIEALVTAIRQMATEIEPMAAGARNRAQERLSLERMLGGYRRALEESLG